MRLGKEKWGRIWKSDVSGQPPASYGEPKRSDVGGRRRERMESDLPGTLPKTQFVRRKIEQLLGTTGTEAVSVTGSSR
jgi:hypothetical protein